MKLTFVLSALLALAVALPADCGPGGNGINKGEKGPGKKGPGEKRPDEERQGQTRHGKKEGEDHKQRERDKPKEAHGGKYVASNRDFSPASNSSAEESSRGNPRRKPYTRKPKLAKQGLILARKRNHEENLHQKPYTRGLYPPKQNRIIQLRRHQNKNHQQLLNLIRQLLHQTRMAAKPQSLMRVLRPTLPMVTLDQAPNLSKL